MSSRQAISYSSFIGESIPVEYQDFGVTPILLMGKPPWLPPGLDESFAGFRDNAITRYKEKNKRRKIRSDSHGAYVSQWAHVRRDTTSTSDVLAAEFLQKDARLAV